jgi:uncharacterized protein (TIGR02453 family)
MTTIFNGFPSETLDFLRDLEGNNNRDWFEANKERYERVLLEPAVEFVTAVGSGLQHVAPEIQVDPRTNGQGVLMRIYRDVRFSKDKSPYKTAVSGVFTDGKGKKMTRPGFGFYMTANGMELMGGMFGFDKAQLAAYQAAVADEEKGLALVAAVESIANKPAYEIVGEQYKRLPAGYDAGHPRADLLRYKGLYASPRAPLSPDIVTGEELVPTVLVHFEVMAPLYNWLVANVG